MSQPIYKNYHWDNLCKKFMFPNVNISHPIYKNVSNWNNGHPIYFSIFPIVDRIAKKLVKWSNSSADSILSQLIYIVDRIVGTRRSDVRRVDTFVKASFIGQITVGSHYLPTIRSTGIRSKGIRSIRSVDSGAYSGFCTVGGGEI